MNVLIYEPDIPGNLGNIVRSASGFSVDNLYIYDPKGLAMPSAHRSFQRRVIATSEGAWNKINPVIFYQEGQVNKFLAEYASRKIATVCNDSKATWIYGLDCHDQDLVIFGNEKEGLPQEIIDASDLRVSIPTKKRLHSLNVASAFAVIAYEYSRQAYQKHKKR